MPLDVKTPETIVVNGDLYRRAMAAAFCTAVNNSSETLGSPVQAEKEIAYFNAACLVWTYPIFKLRLYMRWKLGDNSAAYKSIPDLFTKG